MVNEWYSIFKICFQNMFCSGYFKNMHVLIIPTLEHHRVSGLLLHAYFFLFIFTSIFFLAVDTFSPKLSDRIVIPLLLLILVIMLRDIYYSDSQHHYPILQSHSSLLSNSLLGESLYSGSLSTEHFT